MAHQALGLALGIIFLFLVRLCLSPMLVKYRRQLGRQIHSRILSFAYLWHQLEKILLINEVDISWYQ